MACYERARVVTSVDGMSGTISDLRTTTGPAFLHYRTVVAGCTGEPRDANMVCGVPGANDGLCRLNSSSRVSRVARSMPLRFHGSFRQDVRVVDRDRNHESTYRPR